MSKKTLTTPTSPLEQLVMQQITSGKVTMRPKWFFVVGSLLTGIGVVGSLITTVFLINVGLFLSRQHGPGGDARLQLMLSSFPMWVVPLALLAIGIGLFALKHYEFSYKKNFTLIIIGFLVAIIITAMILDQTGLSTTWFSRGPMRQWYLHQNSENQQDWPRRGNGRWQ